jgi:hypothetical protein
LNSVRIEPRARQAKNTARVSAVDAGGEGHTERDCHPGAAHDRWFLDRVATHVLAFEGESETVWFEGNYGAYIEDLKRRKGADADQPHRLKYKPLVR